MNFIGIKIGPSNIEWIPKYKYLPSGFTYIQFPNELSPMDIWGGSTDDWENISSTVAGRFIQDESGYFYRVEGGSAVSFGGSQAQSTFANAVLNLGSCGNHNHSCKTRTACPGGGNCGYYWIACDFHSSTNTWNHNHSVSYGSTTCNGETQPINYTVRLWRKK